MRTVRMLDSQMAYNDTGHGGTERNSGGIPDRGQLPAEPARRPEVDPRIVKVLCGSRIQVGGLAGRRGLASLAARTLGGPREKNFSTRAG